MNALLAEALDRWGLAGARATLAAARENRVYRVETGAGALALRVHRPGYREDAELAAELSWVKALAERGFPVAEPVAARSGAYLERVGGAQVDVIRWLDGAPLGARLPGMSNGARRATFRRLGETIAALHEISDAWTRPEGFTRWSWDRDGLVGERPLWGRFWENPTLDAEDRRLMEWLRDAARDAFDGALGRLDYGLIHADLVRDNVIVGYSDGGGADDGGPIRLIDFDDAGFGFRLFEIATALLNHADEPDYDALKAALLAGYRARRPLDDNRLDWFMALRAATYVGWVVPRLAEDGAPERNLRYIARTRRLAARLVDGEA